MAAGGLSPASDSFHACREGMVSLSRRHVRASSVALETPRPYRRGVHSRNLSQASCSEGISTPMTTNRAEAYETRLRALATPSTSASPMSVSMNNDSIHRSQIAKLVAISALSKSDTESSDEENLRVWGVPLENSRMQPLLALRKSLSKVSCGLHHTAAVADDGTVYTWGVGSLGRLGQGAETFPCTLPTQVDALSHLTIVAVSCGFAHTLALTDDGVVHAWGWGAYGQLGQNSLPNDMTHTGDPIQMKIDEAKIKSIACGYAHSVLLTDDGNVYFFGSFKSSSDKKNPLSKPSPDPANCKVLPLAEKGAPITNVSSGQGHVVALDELGRVYVWGHGVNGQLGLGPRTTVQPSPKVLPSLCHQKMSRVSCGWHHTIAISERGDVFVWGKDTCTSTLGDAMNSRDFSTPNTAHELHGSHVLDIGAGPTYNVALLRPSSCDNMEADDSSEDVPNRLGGLSPEVDRLNVLEDGVNDFRNRLRGLASPTESMNCGSTPTQTMVMNGSGGPDDAAKRFSEHVLETLRKTDAFETIDSEASRTRTLWSGIQQKLHVLTVQRNKAERKGLGLESTVQKLADFVSESEVTNTRLYSSILVDKLCGEILLGLSLQSPNVTESATQTTEQSDGKFTPVRKRLPLSNITPKTPKHGHKKSTDLFSPRTAKMGSPSLPFEIYDKENSTMVNIAMVPLSPGRNSSTLTPFSPVPLSLTPRKAKNPPRLNLDQESKTISTDLCEYDRDGEIERLRAQIAELEKDKAFLENQCHDAAAMMKETSAQVVRAQSTVEDFQTHIASLSLWNDALKTTNRTLMSSNKSLAARANVFESENKMLLQDMLACKMDMERLLERNNSLVSDQAGLHSRVDSLTEERQSLRTKVSSIMKLTENHMEAVKKLRLQEANYEVERERLTDSLTNALQEVRSLEQDLLIERGVTHSLREKLNELEVAHKELGNDLVSCRDRLASQEICMQQEIAKREKVIAGLDAEVEAAGAYVNKLSRDLDSERGERKASRAVLEQAQAQLNHTTKLINDIRSKSVSLVDAAGHHARQRGGLCGKHSVASESCIACNLVEELQKLETQVQCTLHNYDTLRQESISQSELDDLMAEARKDRDMWFERASAAQHNIEDLEDDKKQREAAIAGLTTMLQTVFRELQAASVESLRRKRRAAISWPELVEASNDHIDEVVNRNGVAGPVDHIVAVWPALQTCDLAAAQAVQEVLLGSAELNKALNQAMDAIVEKVRIHEEYFGKQRHESPTIDQDGKEAPFRKGQQRKKNNNLFQVVCAHLFLPMFGLPVKDSLGARLK